MTDDNEPNERVDHDIDSLFGDGETGDEIDFDNLFSEDGHSQANLPSNKAISGHLEDIRSGKATLATKASSITICAYKENPQHGLGWSRGTFSLTPIWTVVPTIESIIQTLQGRIGPDKIYHVKHCRDGPYNKFYLVTYDESHFILKITLPIWPTLKTESEVATLAWVHHNTELPAPKVKCYDSSRDNPIGFEWILMDRMEGQPLAECWDSMSDGSLQRLIWQIAKYTAAAFDNRFNGGIGNIYPAEPESDNTELRLGELVWMPFFWGERGYLEYPRGPFHNVREWNESRLQFSYSNLSTAMQFMRRGYDEKRAWEDGARMLKLINRVRNLGHKFFPSHPRPDGTREQREDEERPSAPVLERTMLWHDNLSLDNILVKDGVLMGILDWECVSCLPLHQACHLPAFLQMKGAADTELPYTAPDEYSYLDDETFELPALTSFYRDTRQYEISACRRIFFDEMKWLSPGWLQMYRQSADQKDFEAAVQHCDNEFAYKLVEKWVDAMEKGEAPGNISPRLHEQLYSD
ncbi:hypothetical protein DL767_008234 [Monosporascus sp. MG133]|nr:hypothetical protein DL767_008234 [Monosporascus sp. MG133]